MSAAEAVRSVRAAEARSRAGMEHFVRARLDEGRDAGQWGREGQRAAEASVVLDPEGPERIGGVEVQHEGVRWLLGKPCRHHHCLWAMSGHEGAGLERPARESAREHDQGFVTTHGRYVTREEGWAIAEREGQLSTATYVEAGEADRHPVPGTLFSEDLW